MRPCWLAGWRGGAVSSDSPSQLPGAYWLMTPSCYWLYRCTCRSLYVLFAVLLPSLAALGLPDPPKNVPAFQWVDEQHRISVAKAFISKVLYTCKPTSWATIRWLCFF